MSEMSRIATALERIAESQKNLADKFDEALDSLNELVVEAKIQSDYLIRSEERTKHINALTSLFYIHCFRRDGMQFVQEEGGVYRTIPAELSQYVKDNDELREMGKKMQEALEKFTVTGPKLP